MRLGSDCWERCGRRGAKDDLPPRFSVSEAGEMLGVTDEAGERHWGTR